MLEEIFLEIILHQYHRQFESPPLSNQMLRKHSINPRNFKKETFSQVFKICLLNTQRERATYVLKKGVLGE